MCIRDRAKTDFDLMEANLKFSVIFSLNCCQLILYRWSAAMLLLLVEYSEIYSTLDGRILFSRNSRIDREKYCDKLSTTCVIKELVLKRNIAKGTTDPRVEFISQDHSSQFTNLEHNNFRMSIKHLLQNLNHTSASRQLNLNLKS